MDKFQCHIEHSVDDAGVYTFYATRFEDYDVHGIPVPTSPRGVGETELEAVVDLCEELQVLARQEAA